MPQLYVASPLGFSETNNGLEAPQSCGYLRAWSGALHMPFLHETRRSGQPNCYMDDLALAPRAQLETAGLEQL